MAATELSDDQVFGSPKPATSATPETDADVGIKPTVPQTTPTGVAKNVAAASAVDFPSTILNLVTDAPSNLLMRPLAIGFGTAYDAAAHAFGFTPMSPEQRADLYGLPQPGQTQLPPEQQQVGTRIMNAVDQAIPGQKASTLPATPAEAAVRTATGAALTAGATGPGGFIAPAVAAGTSVAAPEIAKHVPDWAQSATELAVNTVPQLLTGALASKGTPTVDPADAATMQMARTRYNVPLDATDITPGSQFRTPGSVQAKTDALQANIVKEMGQDPNTPDLLSRNKITTDVMTNTANDTGKIFDDVASRTNINPNETSDLVTKLAAIDHGLDLENLTDSQKAMIRRNIDLVQDAAVRGNGTISGSDYQGLTRTNTPIDRLAGNSDSNVSAVGMQIKSAIDDGFQNSASQPDQAALSQARYQWRLMKTVEPLVAKAQGANIDPGEFASRAVAVSKKLDGSTGGIAYTGGGTIGDLARIAGVIDRGPTPTSPSLWKDLTHPPGGPMAYYLDPKLAGAAHAAQVVGSQVAGPYLRSGFNAQQVINNALYRPSLVGGMTAGALSGAEVDANRLLQPPP